MLIKLTDANNKNDITVAAHMVLMAQRNPQNPMASRVFTGMMGPQGPFVFECLESPDTIRGMVNHALHQRAMMENGQPVAFNADDTKPAPVLVK